MQIECVYVYMLEYHASEPGTCDSWILKAKALQRIPAKLLFQKYMYVASKSYAYQQKFRICVSHYRIKKNINLKYMQIEK